MVIEVTGNSAAVERIMRPHVKRVAVASPRPVRAIAYNRVKTDKVDGTILAKLYAAGFLPEVWVADENTYARRRQTAERAGVLEQLVRIKGRMKAILHGSLIPPYKCHLFGKAAQKWLEGLPLPAKERGILARLMLELERVSGQLAEIDKVLAQECLDDPRALRLMTIPGVSPVVASIVLASIGDITRFRSPDKLSSYIGLIPRIWQSGDHPARHGRISKQGNGDVRKATTRIASDVLGALVKAVPYRVHTVLTDNGLHFTNPRSPGSTVDEIKRFMAAGEPFRAHAFDYACAQLDIEHWLTKPKHPWTNGQVEHMNRTIKDATVRRSHYDAHSQLRRHLADFVDSYNYARRLKTLRGLTPYEAICKAWTNDAKRFILDPLTRPGLNTRVFFRAGTT